MKWSQKQIDELCQFWFEQGYHLGLSEVSL